jgi:rubrerythrin
MSFTDKVLELLDMGWARRNNTQISLANNRSATNNVALGRAFAMQLTDVDILQFALTLEHLESAMYSEMLATNILTGKERTYFTAFGAAEAAHVVALTDGLSAAGADPVAALDSYNFPAFNNRKAILDFAKVAEDLGVGAYQGAAAAIANKDYLAAAGSIVQVEARHAAIVNILLGQKPVPAAVTSSLTVEEVLAAVNPILGA